MSRTKDMVMELMEADDSYDGYDGEGWLREINGEPQPEKCRATLTIDRLHELLKYEPATGLFTWAISRKKVSAGSIAGTKNGQGYIQICIDGRIYGAHRIALFYTTGVMPSADVDHMNGVRDDNRYTNLREASRSANLQNQRASKGSGLLGTSFVKSTNRWHARIYVNGKTISLGCYPTSAEAHQQYLLAKRVLHEGCTI